MKIAVISDIHGNYDALVAVLSQAKKEGIEHLLVLGDIVGYYYYPDKILNLLSQWNFDLIKGNHEKILEELIANPALGISIRLKYGSGHQEAIHKLTKLQLDFLSSLPEIKSVQLDGIFLLMCHGSPWSNDYYIYPDSRREVLDKCDSKAHDFVLIGHSHYAFAVQNVNSILINPGSVGQSRQAGGKASWVIINTDNCSFQTMTTDYSIEKLKKDIMEKDPDISYLTTILERNQNYD
jgi:putative phosphoesterase